METLRVGLGGRSYDIYIGGGILDSAGVLTAQVHNSRHAVILSDDIVWPLYGGRLLDSLDAAGFETQLMLIPNGEGSKTVDKLGELLEFMAESGLTRSDMLIAFGGGVVGDLGGFAAAAYMRGIDYIQIPTTLLAQVDSSVGGKTAVDLRHGKNLAGAFHQPRLVIADTELLISLPDREFAGGMAEVIKYGAIRSRDLFEKLERHPGRESVMEIMPEVIYECCDIKRRIVENDEFDTGERMVLNFGHTFGHAVEKIGGYEKYIHGEGVAIGMGFAAEYGEKTGNSVTGLRERITALCSAFGLPEGGEISGAQITPHVSLDKKAVGNMLRLVMVRDIGESFVITVGHDNFGKVMESL